MLVKCCSDNSPERARSSALWVSPRVGQCCPAGTQCKGVLMTFLLAVSLKTSQKWFKEGVGLFCGTILGYNSSRWEVILAGAGSSWSHYLSCQEVERDATSTQFNSSFDSPAPWSLKWCHPQLRCVFLKPRSPTSLEIDFLG